MEVTKLHLSIFLLNPEYYQNEIWSYASVLYDKPWPIVGHGQTFLTCLWLNAGDWSLASGPLMVLLK